MRRSLAAVVVPLVLAASPVLAIKVGERTGGERLSIDGYAHVQWALAYFPGAADASWQHYGFTLRRGRVQLEYEFTDRVATTLEIGCDELDLEVKDASIGYRVGAPLRLVAGVQKMPFSREELRSSSRLVMVERSATNSWFDSLGYLGRDIGLVAAGELLPGGRPLGWALGVFNGNGARAVRDDNDAKQFAERLTFEPARWLALGVNATQRNDSLSGRLMTAWGGDAALKFGPAAIEVEALAADGDSAQTALGAWLTGSVRLGSLEPAVRLERFTPDLGDAGGATVTLCAGLNWYLHERVRLKANVTVVPGDAAAGNTLVVEAQAGF
ncbi:MAG: porin [bacterium]